jgi:CheY-like chemotaxis protein
VGPGAGFEPASRPGELRGTVILVVEDSRDAAEAARLTLEAFGARVTLAGDGLEALGALQDRVPHLVLCDLDMPRLDGLGFIARLRADARWAALPVLAVSGFRRPADRQRAGAAGFAGQVAKPFDADTLLAAIRPILRRLPVRGMAPARQRSTG